MHVMTARGLLPLAATLLPLGFAPVHAEDEQQVEPPLSRTIIVTARKQSEALEKTAAPVSVLSGRALLEGGIVTPDQLAERFVGLTVMPNSTGNLLFIRGVGGFTLTANAEPAVGWNYDGVYVSRPMGTFGQLFDLDRVELLKGPQGALHGRNASGGTVNLIPRQPVLGETEAFASVSFGNYDTLNSEAMINLPMGQDGALRIAAQTTSQDNFLSGIDKGPSQIGLRLQMASKTAAGVSVRIGGDYTHLGGAGLGTVYLGKYVLNRATGRFGYIASDLGPKLSTRSPEGQSFRQNIFLPTLGRNLNALSAEPRQSHDFYGVHATIEADLGDAKLTLIPAWRYNDILGIPPGAPFEYLHRENQEQQALEARIAGKIGVISGLFGGYVFKEDVEVDYAQSFGSSLGFQEQSYRTTSISSFGQATIALTPTIRLGGGLRATRERKRNIATNTTFTLTCPRIVNGAPSCPAVPLFPLFGRTSEIPFPIPGPGQPPIPVLSGGIATGALMSRSVASSDAIGKNNSLTWRGTLEMDVGESGLLYASVANGLRPGGTNVATGFETYKPERLVAYTLGARWKHPRGLLSGALELFWWDYRDQHVSSLQPDLSAPPRNALITRNIGRSRIKGADLELNLRPARLTNGYLNIEYLDSKYLDYSFPQSSPASVPLTGCETTRIGTSIIYNVDCTNQRPYASPKWTISLGLRQAFDLGKLRLAIMARTRFASRMMAGSAFLPEQYVPGHWMSHGQFIVTDHAEKYEISAFVRNIEGTRFPTLINIHPTSNAPVASTAAPRTYGVRLSAKF